MGGEYLAYLISHDQSFMQMRKNLQFRNRYQVSSRYQEDVELKNKYVYDTEQFYSLVDQINNQYRVKNTIIFSHYDGNKINLINNIIPIQLCCGYDHYSFFHTLAILKIYCSFLDSDKQDIQALETSELFGLEKASDIVRFTWEHVYLNWRPNNNYQQLDIGNMIDNPNNCKQLEKYFNIKFPVDQFAEKINNDRLLIEELLNISMETFYRIDHIRYLELYVTALLNKQIEHTSPNTTE